MKKGISLIVLVITIIVVMVLAITVVISFSSSNEIDKSNTVVKITSAKQLEQLAAAAWADAYVAGERDVAKLKEAVDKAIATTDIDKNRFEVIVTTTGVTVVDKTLKVDEEPDLLAIPTIAITENRLVITDASGKADRYVIYVNGVEKTTTTINNVALDSLGLTTGTYNITVKATASGYADSELSTSASYSVISFMLGATTYYTRTGSAWTEWVNSAYNTVGATTSGDIVYVGGAYVTMAGSLPAEATSLITSGAIYGLYIQSSDIGIGE